MRILYLVAVVGFVGSGLVGCTNKNLISQRDQEIMLRDQQIIQLEQEVERLQQEASDASDHADQLNADLQDALGELQAQQKLWLEAKEGLSEITMPNAASFASGSTQLTDEGRAIIDKVWEVLSRYPDREILIEGHTDDVPIAPAFRERYETNWELSAARALAVLHYVRDTHNADAQRLAAVGCGEYRPVADNGSEEGRAKNRRVVIVVGTREGIASNL